MKNLGKFPFATFFIVLFILVFNILDGDDKPELWFALIPIYAFILSRCYCIANTDGKENLGITGCIVTILALFWLAIALIAFLFDGDIFPITVCWITLTVEAIVAPVVDLLDANE